MGGGPPAVRRCAAQLGRRRRCRRSPMRSVWVGGRRGETETHPRGGVQPQRAKGPTCQWSYPTVCVQQTDRTQPQGSPSPCPRPHSYHGPAGSHGLPSRQTLPRPSPQGLPLPLTPIHRHGWRCLLHSSRCPRPRGSDRCGAGRGGDRAHPAGYPSYPLTPLAPAARPASPKIQRRQIHLNCRAPLPRGCVPGKRIPPPPPPPGPLA